MHWNQTWSQKKNDLIAEFINGPSTRYRDQYTHQQGFYPMNQTELYRDPSKDPLCDILCGRHSTFGKVKYFFPPIAIWKETRYREELWSKDNEKWLTNKLEAVREKRAKGRTEKEWLYEMTKSRKSDAATLRARPNLETTVTEWRAQLPKGLAGSPLSKAQRIKMESRF